MSRLQSQLHRLYLPRSQVRAETEASSSTLIDPLDRVRAMVIELTRPPSWEVVSRIWRGVQTELNLPAPAIAVSGLDGLQLWFSLEEPIAIAQAHAFLDRLRCRFMPDIEPARVRLMPAWDASALRQELHARLVPAPEGPDGHWSAFVAPDLAPVFADTPWLDIAPNEEGQATLLRGLNAMERTAFDAAFEKLGPAAHRLHSTAAVAGGIDEPLTRERPPAAPAAEDPRRFLLHVMNDDAVVLALRIEAAKALLQHSNESRPKQSD
jgi:hypothetical protein